MAKNWTIGEAAEAILSGNKEDIIDIGRRFPLVLNAVSLMGKNEGGMAIIGAIPQHITARKVESILKDGVTVSEDEIEDPKELEVEEPKKETKKRATKKTVKEEVDTDSDADDYEDMSEVELFKLCKSKGIKAAPKKDKDYYIDLLTNSDDDEDEEPEEKPVKKTKKAEKPVAKKTKKEAPINKPVVEDDDDEDEDEDEDWDI